MSSAIYFTVDAIPVFFFTSRPGNLPDYRFRFVRLSVRRVSMIEGPSPRRLPF